jgi:hypothetical protein
MALQDLPVRISLRGGVDKKTDQRLVIPSKLTEAYDVELDGMDIITRAGTSVRDIPGGFSTGVRMFEHNKVPNIEMLDGSTVRANGSAFVSQYATDTAYDNGTNKFTRVGVVTNRIQGLTRKEPGVGASLYGVSFDCAVGVSTYCLAWEQDRFGYAKWSVRDLATDAEISGGTFSAGSDLFVNPRVIYDSTNARFSIFYARYKAGAVSFDVVGHYVPAAGGALVYGGLLITTANGVLVESTVASTALFDVAIVQGLGYAVVARGTIAAGNIYMVLVGLGLVAITTVTNAAPAAPPVSLTAHATFDGATFTAHAFYGAGLNLRGYRHVASVQSAEVTVVGPFATTRVGRIVVTDFTGGDLLLTFDGFTSTTNSYAFTNVLRCTTAHVLVSQVNATSITGFVAGRSFTMRGRDFVPVLFTSTKFQSVLLVFDLTEAATGLNTLKFPTSIVARLDWGEAAAPSPLALNSGHRVPSCSESLLPYVKFETNTRLAGVTNNTEICVAAARFSPIEQLGDAKWNGLTYLAGALPMITDGVQLVEEGFHFNPEVVGNVVNGLVVIPPLPTGTGKFTFPGIGTFICAFTDSWEDAQGNWHESGVSSLCSVATSGGNLDIDPTILRPPSLKGTRKLQIYRTLQSSTNTTLYLAQSDQYGVGAYVSEADLPSGEVLYTEGGILGNTPAPSCRHMAVFDERMVLSGCGDGSRLYWSKQVSPGFSAEFVADEVSFQQVVKSELGRVVATAEMSGKLVVVGENAFGVLFGTGPNSSGVGRYASVETVATGIGALWTAPKSVKLATEGIWFQSKYGLRLFTSAGVSRAQTGDFVGSDLDPMIATTGNPPVVALSGGATQQTQFFNNSYCFVWDQTWGQFVVYTRHASVDACLINGVYFFLQNNAGVPRLQYRNQTSAQDQGEASVVRGLIQTAPIQVAGLQGFQRVRRMLALGAANYGSAPSFDIEVAYDGEQILGTPEFSNAAPLVSVSGVFQFQHQFFKQKCQSMLLRLTFSDQFGVSRVRITDLALAVGVKYGSTRTPENV